MIHEGTHGIQGLDLLGRKVTLHEGAGLDLVLGRIRVTCAKAVDLHGELPQMAAALGRGVSDLQRVTGQLSQHPDRSLALAHSTAYLEAFGHLVLAWVWLDQLIAVDGKQGAFYEGKRRAARYFFRWELPRTHNLLGALEELDDTTLHMSEQCF